MNYKPPNTAWSRPHEIGVESIIDLLFTDPGRRLTQTVGRINAHFSIIKEVNDYANNHYRWRKSW